jgi:hypothetical protein
VAASLFVAGLGLWFGGDFLFPRGHSGRKPSPTTAANAAAAVADADGLLTLASLKLPVACVPLSHRPLAFPQASEIAAGIGNGSLAGLRCCTECHHAGGNVLRRADLAALSAQHCQICHRG